MRSLRYAMTLRRVYVSLLAVAMVVGPAWWLLLTEDGRRRTDAVMLRLWGRPEVALDLTRLAPYGEAELLALYNHVQWTCATRAGPFGQRRCVAQIGVFNGIPAHSLAFYFHDGRLSALKLIYRRRYHGALLRQLHRALGGPSREAGVLRWSTGHGLLVVKARVAPSDAAALIWIVPALRTVPATEG